MLYVSYKCLQLGTFIILERQTLYFRNYGLAVIFTPLGLWVISLVMSLALHAHDYRRSSYAAALFPVVWPLVGIATAWAMHT